MHRLIILIFLLPIISLRAQEDTPHELLPKEAFETLQRHAIKVYRSSEKLIGDWRFSTQDERVLLHLPKRGFPSMALLINNEVFRTWAVSTLFMPEGNLRTGSREEGIADELLSLALVNRVLANKYACFCLVKELAPSPEAMRMEKQAKDLAEKVNSKGGGFASETEFLDLLEKVRSLFDQLKDLPKMTSEEFASERAESAVLAPEEYFDDSRGTLPPDQRGWPNEQLNRQTKWNREGYLLAYSQCSGPNDYERFQMVIKPQGGIFEAEQSYASTHAHPESYESKLLPSEIHALEDFLARMPPSDASGEEVHFIISFSKDGTWVTRTYGSLSAENPFQPLLRRMLQQSVQEFWTENSSKKAEFLAPAQ